MSGSFPLLPRDTDSGLCVRGSPTGRRTTRGTMSESVEGPVVRPWVRVRLRV